jgi:hypothetical protein
MKNYIYTWFDKQKDLGYIDVPLHLQLHIPPQLGEALDYPGVYNAKQQYFH